MKYRQLFPIILALFVLDMTGCQNTVIQPELTGRLVGYVFTFGEYASLLEDHSQVKVTTLGIVQYSTYTDRKGRFEFKGLPAGTYDLQFEKDGFGTLKQFGIQHLGGKPTTLGLSFDPAGNGSAFFIYQMPTIKIADLSVDKDTLSADLVFSTLAPNYLTFLVYYSINEGFETSEAQLVNEVFLEKKNNLYKGKIYDIADHFENGAKVYFRASELNRRQAIEVYLGDYVIGIDDYNDLSTNAIIYPNLGNESEQYSFILQK